jgi:hypothetical protein
MRSPEDPKGVQSDTSFSGKRSITSLAKTRTGPRPILASDGTKRTGGVFYSPCPRGVKWDLVGEVGVGGGLFLLIKITIAEQPPQARRSATGARRA